MKRTLWILLFFLAASLPARANTYTVTNTNDWWFGSLRWAIEDANKHAGFDTIVFAIGSGPKTIRLDTPLPPIKDGVLLDGWTQPGWTGNPIIELDGAKVTNGLGLEVQAPSTIRGLVINRFGRSGLGIGDDFAGHVGNFTTVHGCWIGIGLDGVTGRPNGRDGIRIFANDVTIGGDGPNQRNVIGANAENGIAIGREPWGGQISTDRGSRARIRGNLIGVNIANGRVPNTGCGIEVFGGLDSVIGGDTPTLGNTIASNGAEGIKLDNWELNGGPPFVQRTIIRNNKIGRITMANGGGITVLAPQTTIDKNEITYNNGAGVVVRIRNQASITNNSIYNNAGLGIDLGASNFDTGVTPNDPGDFDIGGNSLLNFPVLTAVVQDGQYTRVRGKYEGAAYQPLSLDFYKNGGCDGSGYGEGETFLATTAVATNSSGVATFDFYLPWAGIATYVTATARDASGNTSEFSKCYQSTFGRPGFSGMNPPGGRTASTITVTGTDLIFVNSVKFWNGSAASIPATFSVVDNNTLSVVVPPLAKIGPIGISSPYGSVLTSAFRATPPAGDFSADGRPDLVWRNYRTGQNQINTSDGPVATLPAMADLYWEIQGTGDFNNDGSHDILWRNYDFGWTRIWLMNGTTYTGTDAVLPNMPDTDWHIDAVADFDGDGDPDLLYRNRLSGQAYLWVMNGATYSNNAYIMPTNGPEWTLEGAADFNRDGWNDLLWRNYTTGENAIWPMIGSLWTGTSIPLQTIPDPNWTIENAVDWDGDGDPDLVWRNLTAGANVVWLLNGTSWDGTSVAAIPAEPDTDMRIEDR